MIFGSLNFKLVAPVVLFYMNRVHLLLNSNMFVVVVYFNPLERDLNVSRNVTFEELERLTTEITNARYLLEGLEPVDQAKHEPWGILRLCNSNTHPVALKAGNIAIDWKDFFSPEPERASSADIADDVPLSSRNTSPEQNTASTKKGTDMHLVTYINQTST
ncbi:poly(A) RNA polymerase, mitochondrial-like [Macrobrachium nipponense]|uniref:poly(A) RNA polymerase, mitochondrial-like n=1 Tax=Macrobrachium nipponense TaxID=159736 RepID=UPI0030C85156